MTTVVGSLKVLLGLDAADFVSGFTKADSVAAAFAEKQKRNAAAIDRSVASLQKQAAMLGMSARQQKLFELATQGATVAQLKSADAALRQVAAHAAFTRVAGAAGTAAAAAAAGFLLLFDAQTKALDAFNDLSDVSGSSVEKISALDSVARRTGATFDTVETALIKFNAALKEAKPGDDVSRVLTALGLSAAELKRQDPADALLTLSLALDQFADDGEKARAVQTLLGKSIKEVGPFLKDLAEQGKLVTKTTTEQAQEAERYQKNLSELKTGAEDLARSLVNFLVPSINAGQKAMRDARAEGAGFFGQLFAANKATGGAFWDSVFGTEQENKAARMADQIKAINGLLENGNLTLERRARLEKQLAGLTTTAAQEDPARDALRRMEASYVPAKPPLKVPGAPVKGGGDPLKAALEARLDEIRDFADQQRDAYEFANRYLDGVYRDGLVDLQTYFDAQSRMREASLTTTTDQLDKEKEALEADAKRFKVGTAERIEAEAKVRDVVRERADAVQKAGQAEILALETQGAATAEAKRRYADLRATILELQGDNAGAAAIRIAQQVKEAREAIRNAGGDPGLADTLGAKLTGAAQLADVQREYNLLLQRTQDREEALAQAAADSGATELETLRAVGTARRLALSDLAALVAKANELARGPGATPEALQFAEGLATAYRKAAAEIDPLLAKERDLARDLGDTLANSFENALISGGNLRTLLQGLGSDIERIIVRKLATEPLADSLTNLLGGTGQSGGLLSGIFGSGSGSGAAGADKAKAEQTATDKAIEFAKSLGTGQTGLDNLGTSALSVVAGNTTGAVALTNLATSATAAAIALDQIAAAGASNAVAGGGGGGGFFDSILGFFTGGSGGGGGGSGGGWLDLIMSFFGGGSGLSVDTGGSGLTSGGTSLASLGLGGGRAGGGPVMPGGLYEVAENRPEMLDVNGRKFLMMGRQRGNVDPSARMGRSTQVVNAPVTLNMPAGTSTQTANQAAAAVALRIQRARMRNA